LRPLFAPVILHMIAPEVCERLHTALHFVVHRFSEIILFGTRGAPRSVRSWCVLSFVGEAIHHLLGGKSGDGKAADRLQAVVAAVIDEILRSEDGSAQAAGKFLKPRRQVYRRADASEIQPVAAADIAEQHVADMQRQTKAQAAAIAVARTQCGNLIARRSAGFQCGGADRREIALGADRKDRQQSVAHIFEHFAAMLDDRRHLAVEIAIEQIDQILRRQRVGQRGEAAHVGQPDRGVDRLGIAAANMSREHALAGVLADISGQEIAGDAIPGADFGDPRQRRNQRLDGLDLGIGKTAGLPCRPQDEKCTSPPEKCSGATT